jgi:hypothetical protein
MKNSFSKDSRDQYVVIAEESKGGDTQIRFNLRQVSFMAELSARVAELLNLFT